MYQTKQSKTKYENVVYRRYIFCSNLCIFFKALKLFLRQIVPPGFPGGWSSSAAEWRASSSYKSHNKPTVELLIYSRNSPICNSVPFQAVDICRFSQIPQWTREISVNLRWKYSRNDSLKARRSDQTALNSTDLLPDTECGWSWASSKISSRPLMTSQALEGKECGWPLTVTTGSTTGVW